MKLWFMSLCLVAACAVTPSDEVAQEAKGGGGGGGGGGGQPDPYLGFLDELSRPESSIDGHVRAGMPDARIFWATGNPIPNNITVTSVLPTEITTAAGGYTYPTGERQRTNPTGYRLPITFTFPREAIGATYSVTASTTTDRGTRALTQVVTVVDAPTTPTGVTVEKVGLDLVVRWAPSQFGIGPIHYIVENLTCVTPRVCSGVTVADTADTTVTFRRSNALLRIRAVATSADSNLFEMDISTL